MSEYQPVPVFVARNIATTFQKHIVVILAYDEQHEKTHCTTYGRSPEQKLIAAEVGERCAAVVSDTSQRTRYEDFRDVPAAERAAQVDALAQACRAADHALASLLAVRDGISDELLQGVRQAIAEAFEKAGVQL